MLLLFLYFAFYLICFLICVLMKTQQTEDPRDVHTGSPQWSLAMQPFWHCQGSTLCLFTCLLLVMRDIYPKNIQYLASLLRLPAKDLNVKRDAVYSTHTHCTLHLVSHSLPLQLQDDTSILPILKNNHLKKKRKKVVSCLPRCVPTVKLVLLSVYCFTFHSLSLNQNSS